MATQPPLLPAEDLAAFVRGRARPLPPLDDAAFAAAFDAFGEARLVLLGEATHGTREFYEARAAITRRLIDRHGFRIVAVEGDWPDVAELDRFIRNRGVWGQKDSFPNFPRWMWRNAEFVAFVHSLRAWNLERPMADRVELRGLDVYSLSQSRREVLDYLDRVDPQAAGEARRRYGCLTPYLDQPQRYGAAARMGAVDCKEAVVAQLVSLLRNRLDYSRQDGEDYLDAAQNARVVRSAEAYYRAMYRGSVESWNLRDSHMFDTLGHLLAGRGPRAKAVVWAHNSHLGDASATEMGAAGEFNLGQLCREAFDRDCVSIGFGADRGQVAAADDWGGPVRFKQVLPARDDSWERIFRQAGPSRSLTDWRADAALAQALGETRLERAIGVIYRPETERRSHYFDARLSAQFDAYVWFEETAAVTPLAGAPPEGAPDIYPFGL
ncbi:erythromycin esterase family protein [Brevundimonas naejangsanensis]|uniref:Erythromycin esterase family protein n=1 Tax=Brevundimonas naejangsanensis TaxID=588932 RepID=A0A494RIU3_9CAUL|nr:erythromycin esterase family protein [Brevundimonas naejangsanensis]AYG94953.1 erythromycin esterase family protein [Brevundimonas naejangsanensis]